VRACVACRGVGVSGRGEREVATSQVSIRVNRRNEMRASARRGVEDLNGGIHPAQRPELVPRRGAVFDFELNAEDMQTIVALDSKTSSFFDHRDPKMAKRISGRKGIT